jgi:hypothetical protein
MQRLVEIRSYKLKSGAAANFHQAFVARAVPMLREWGTDVVAHGASPHESDTYFLVRSYVDLADRNARQDAFYSSDAWRSGPREAVIALIDHFLDTLLWLSPAAIDDLRRCNAQ